MAKVKPKKVVVPAGGKPSRIRVWLWQPANPTDTAPMNPFVGAHNGGRFKHTYHMLTGELGGTAGDQAHHAHDRHYEAALAVYDMEAAAGPHDDWPDVAAGFKLITRKPKAIHAKKAAPKKAAPKKAAAKKK